GGDRVYGLHGLLPGASPALRGSYIRRSHRPDGLPLVITMVRQAHAYLVSAVSGATLIAIAIAAFVILVSAQVFKDWPIDAFGGGDGTAAVSSADAVGNGSGAGAGAAKTVSPAVA